MHTYQITFNVFSPHSSSERNPPGMYMQPSKNCFFFSCAPRLYLRARLCSLKPSVFFLLEDEILLISFKAPSCKVFSRGSMSSDCKRVCWNAEPAENWQTANATAHSYVFLPQKLLLGIASTEDYGEIHWYFELYLFGISLTSPHWSAC